MFVFSGVFVAVGVVRVVWLRVVLRLLFFWSVSLFSASCFFF